MLKSRITNNSLSSKLWSSVNSDTNLKDLATTNTTIPFQASSGNFPLWFKEQTNNTTISLRSKSFPVGHGLTMTTYSLDVEAGGPVPNGTDEKVKRQQKKKKKMGELEMIIPPHYQNVNRKEEQQPKAPSFEEEEECDCHKNGEFCFDGLCISGQMYSDEPLNRYGKRLTPSPERYTQSREEDEEKEVVEHKRRKLNCTESLDNLFDSLNYTSLLPCSCPESPEKHLDGFLLEESDWDCVIPSTYDDNDNNVNNDDLDSTAPYESEEEEDDNDKNRNGVIDWWSTLNETDRLLEEQQERPLEPTQLYFSSPSVELEEEEEEEDEEDCNNIDQPFPFDSFQPEMWCEDKCIEGEGVVVEVEDPLGSEPFKLDKDGFYLCEDPICLY